MQATSRDSLAGVRQETEAVIGSATELPSVAADVFAVAELLAAQPRLRRMLSDPAIEAPRRSETASRLLAGRIGAPAARLVQTAVTARWSAPWDLVDALSEVGNELLLGAAEKAGTLDDVEDQLFRFGRILEGQPRLATLLDDRSVPVARRAELLYGVLGSKVDQVTLALVTHALGAAGRASYATSIEDLATATAARQNRSIARVRSAVPLTDAQEQRLAALLSATYGRSIGVRTEVDPAVRGGLVIRVGDELIDGSVATRLATARSALSGR